MLESLFNQVAGLQVCNFIKKRPKHRGFSVNISKFLKKHILKKICERLLLNNVEPKFSSVYWCSYKCFSTFTGKHLSQSVPFNKCNCRPVTKPIFIQKEVPALMFSWQLSEIFSNNYFKKHRYKKKSIVIRKVDQYLSQI